MYKNTLSDFEKWCTDNRMPFDIRAVEYAGRGSTYVEMNKVRVPSGWMLGISIRQYEDGEFKLPPYEDREAARESFEGEISRFCQKHGVKDE